MAVITKVFSTANITIQASADTVEKKIRSLNGIRSVSVNIPSSTMTVEFDPEICDEKMIIQTVRACGYDAYTKEIPVQEEEPAKQPEWVLKKELIAAAIGSIAILILHAIPYSFYICLLIAAAVFWLCRESAEECMQEIRNRKIPGAASIRMITCILAVIFALIAFADHPAHANLFLFSAAAVLTVTSFENSLIARSRSAAARAMQEIRDSMPKTAAVYTDRRETLASVEELHEDQIIRIRPGDTIPADGRVLRGFASMNESALTGLETPVEKSEGSYVYANSVCLSGFLEIKAEKTGSATAMMRLAALAEKTASDTSFRSPLSSLGRGLLAYVAAAALIAAGGWIFSGKDMLFAADVLLCVLASASLKTLKLSSENEVMGAAGEAMSEHIIFRNVEALEMAGRTDYAVIEQEGSVTDRDLNVTDFVCAEGMSESRLEYIAYALESRKNRPFAKAITRYLRSRKMAVTDIEEFTRLSRRGRNAIQSLSSFRSQSYEEILEKGIETGEWNEIILNLISEGKRVLIFTENDTIIGVIAAIRPLIPGAAEAFAQLKNSGTETWLLTDGSEEEANLLNQKLQPDHIVFHPAKDEKERLLAELDEEDTITAYISRDPEQVSQEDVDITVAIGTGADPQIDSAGIMITRSRLTDFVKALDISRQLTVRIGRKQLAILIYHAMAALIFGFILPAILRFPVPPAVSCLCALAVLWVVLNEKKGF